MLKTNEQFMERTADVTLGSANITVNNSMRSTTDEAPELSSTRAARNLVIWHGPVTRTFKKEDRRWRKTRIGNHHRTLKDKDFH
jgi:hypothetical protein